MTSKIQRKLPCPKVYVSGKNFHKDPSSAFTWSY